MRRGRRVVESAQRANIGLLLVVRVQLRREKGLDDVKQLPCGRGAREGRRGCSHGRQRTCKNFWMCTNPSTVLGCPSSKLNKSRSATGSAGMCGPFLLLPTKCRYFL